MSSSVTLLPRRATGVLIFLLARPSSLATLFLMRLTFRLRLPSPDRILLTFCYRIYFPRLPRLPQTFGTRGPRLRLPRLQQTMPATPSGWTLPSCGMVLPTGCPRRSGQTRLPPRLLLRRQVPPPLQLIGSGSASTTLVVRVRHRLLSRRRRRTSSSRRCPRLHRRRQRHPRLQSLLRGRHVPGRVHCRRPCSGMASPPRPPTWLLRCQATPVPRSPMLIGARR